MKKFCTIALLIIAVSGIPVWIFGTCMDISRTNAQKGEITATFWLPKNCEVITDIGKWRKEFENLDNEFFLKVSVERYKKLEDTGTHIVFVSPSEVWYRTFQGKIIVSADDQLSKPRFVSVTDFQYLGNGQVKWKVAPSNWAIPGALALALIVGVILDGVLFVVGIIVWAIADWFWNGLKSSFKQRHRT
jgi:hypothetical protein